MIRFITSIVGQRAAKPVLIVLTVVMVLIILIIVMRCTPDRTVARQTEQTTASGEAIANAAQEAVQTITNRTATEQDIDRATAQAIKEIDHAESADTVRDAVIAGLCGQTSHRNDPACTVR